MREGYRRRLNRDMHTQNNSAETDSPKDVVCMVPSASVKEFMSEVWGVDLRDWCRLYTMTPCIYY